MNKIWTQQPQVPVGIDWSNPITRGLKFAHNPSSGAINLVNGQRALNSTAQDVTVGKSGKRIQGESAGFQSEYSPNGLESAGNSLTIFSVITAQTAQYLGSDGDCYLLSTRDGSNNGWSFGRYQATGGGATGNLTRLALVLQNVAFYPETNYTIPSFVDTPIALRVSGSTASYFSFGMKSSSDETVGTQLSSSGNLIHGGLGPYGTSYNRWLDRAYCTMAWNRALSDAEIRSISQNPWQIFKPIARRLFVPVSAIASADGVGTGLLPSITLAVPLGTATNGAVNGTGVGSLITSQLTAPIVTALGSAAISSLLSNIGFTAPIGSAIGSSSAVASGLISAVVITSPVSTATGSAITTGVIQSSSFNTVPGSATGSATKLTTLAGIALTSPIATAVGSSVATGLIATSSFNVVTGTALGGATRSVVGSTLTLSSPLGSAIEVGSGDNVVTAAIAPMSFTSPNANAIGGATVLKPINQINITAPTGTANVSVAVIGLVSSINISVPMATAIGGAMIQGGIQSIGITSPNGSAHGTLDATVAGLIHNIVLVAPNAYATNGALLFTQEQLNYLLAYMEANMAVPTTAEIAAAVLAAAQVTPISANVQKVNNYPVTGPV